eukprot:14830789-Alexandrium_andersonii.AAC.1
MRRSTEYSVTPTGPGLGSAQPPRFHAAQASNSGSEAWPGVPPARADQPQACAGCQVPSASAD